MALSDIDLEMTKIVVEKFLSFKEATPRRQLVSKFKTPDALDRLATCCILRVINDNNNQKYLPMALAFHYCGDGHPSRLAKQSIEIVLHVLQDLFEAEPDKAEFTPADIEAQARKMYEHVDPQAIWLGLYLAQEFGVFMGWSSNSLQTELVSVRMSERIVTLTHVDSAWDEHVRKYSAYYEKNTMQQGPEGVLALDGDDAGSVGDSGILVLVSHSSKDVALAAGLTELLRAGIGLRADQIRCSSVDGYRLPAGVNTEAQLRVEVNSATVLIGLITPHSLSSPYVLFELGARWGADLLMIPLLAGVSPEELRGPLGLLNALSCSSEEQLHQLLGDVAKPLGLSVQSPPSYLRFLRASYRRCTRKALLGLPTAHPVSSLLLRSLFTGARLAAPGKALTVRIAMTTRRNRYI